MKLHRFYTVMAFCALGLFSQLSAQEMHHHQAHTCECGTKQSVSQEVLDLMHQPMMSSKWVESGNIDRDFVENMNPHHQGAILSSKKILETTKNPRIIQLAKEIIEGQEREIAEFNQLLQKLPKTPSKGYKKFKTQAKADMKEMMQKMAAIKVSGDADKDFLEAMVFHHQGAITASKQVLPLTKNQTVKKMAQEIINEQEREIEEIHSILKDL